MKWIVITLLLALPLDAYAADWGETITTLAPVRRKLPHNVATLRTLLDTKCKHKQVACQVSISDGHHRRDAYASDWYDQCKAGVVNASTRNGGTTWEFFDLRNDGPKDKWKSGGLGEGVQILCRPKPTDPAPPPPPPSHKPPPTTLADADQPTEAEAKIEAPALWSRQFDLTVAIEAFYGLARKKPNGLAAVGFGTDITPAWWLTLTGRVELGGGEYFWPGLRIHASHSVSQSVYLGLTGQAHIGFFGEEPWRLRPGGGIRVLVRDLFAPQWSLEVLGVVTYDITPRYDVPGGHVTSSHDLTPAVVLVVHRGNIL